MDMELLVRLMQMQMIGGSFGSRQRTGGIRDQGFALMLAALMEGQQKGAGKKALPPVAAPGAADKTVKNSAPAGPGVKRAEIISRQGGAGNNAKSDASGLGQMVDKVAVRHGLDPALLRAVVEAESGFDPMALSSAGAMGLMQLMPETAKSLGVKNPYNPAENIDGGARYLKSMLERFRGDLNLALSAYNAGPGAVEQYGGVPPFGETIAYIQRIKSLYGRSTG